MRPTWMTKPVLGNGTRALFDTWGTWAAAQLGKRSARLLFLALGISKPQLLWFVQQEYFDRLPLESIELPEFQPQV